MILAEAARTSLALSDAQKRSLRDHVHETLRFAIIAGRFAENERLTERQLAADLGVSTTPLKEAFRRLEAEGLIETQARRGVRILFGKAWAEEMILARAALESTIAAVAAERITQAQKAELAALIERMRGATDGDDVDRLLALNARFHADIHDASRCHHLTRLMERQQFYDADVRRIIHREVGERSTALEEHSAIARAIVAGSAAEAERLMSHHVRRSGAHYLAFVFTEEGRRRIPA
jgi:DNA-binding GntR family transcriptional regulator